MCISCCSLSLKILCTLHSLFFLTILSPFCVFKGGRENPYIIYSLSIN
nr:MAG TPA: hypothetical protein [Caudoviricetes sp.]